MVEKAPRITQKMQLRLAIGLFVVAGCFLGWYFLKNFLQDPDVGTVDSAGWIAALQDNGQGMRAVILKPDGTVVRSPGGDPDTDDRDPVWSPNGQRIFFSSNRGEKHSAYHIYRWNPANNSVSERSIGTRAQERPTFPADEAPSGNAVALIVSGGIIAQLDPKDGKTLQMVPIEHRDPTQSGVDEEGATDQFGAEFAKLGTSFRVAEWCKNRRYIAGIMRRDEGETLVLQDMAPASVQEALPQAIAAGRHIDMTVDPHTGNIVYSVQGFQFPDLDKVPPQFIKGDKVVLPYDNLLGVVDPSDPRGPNSGVILASKDSKSAFGEPAVSPDGSTVAFVSGAYVSTLIAQGIFVTPLRPVNQGQQASATRIIDGDATAPCWSPDSSQIAFVMSAGGHHDIYSIGKDGSNPKNLTNGKGSFSQPKISPVTHGAS